MKNARHSNYPGKIRIIGGKWRSRTLTISANPGLRPTPDRVRETVFNWLQPYLSGARCIDLFAGSGALCFEALSRGAAHATLIESDGESIHMLCENKEKLDADNAEIVHQDALSFLQQPPKNYNIFFLDPPFKSDYIKKCADKLAKNGWLKQDSIVYIEAPGSLQPLPLPETWELIKNKITGEVGYYLARDTAPTV